MTEMTDKELADLYPDGRTYYDETGDQQGFIDKLVDLGYFVQVNYAKDMEPWATVSVPAKRLGEFLRLGLTVGT